MFASSDEDLVDSSNNLLILSTLVPAQASAAYYRFSTRMNRILTLKTFTERSHQSEKKGIPDLIKYISQNKGLMTIKGHVLFLRVLREDVKNGYFTVRLTVRGGGCSLLGPDRKQM